MEIRHIVYSALVPALLFLGPIACHAAGTNPGIGGQVGSTEFVRARLPVPVR
jgi:hypothetical protein